MPGCRAGKQRGVAGSVNLLSPFTSIRKNETGDPVGDGSSVHCRAPTPANPRRGFRGVARRPPGRESLAPGASNGCQRLTLAAAQTVRAQTDMWVNNEQRDRIFEMIGTHSVTHHPARNARQEHQHTVVAACLVGAIGLLIAVLVF